MVKVVTDQNAPGLAKGVAEQLRAIIPAWSALIDQGVVTVAGQAGPGGVAIGCATTG